MDNRLAVISIILENHEASKKLNNILHDSAQYIIGRMGIPYQKRGLNVITVVIDAPPSVTSSISGKLGMIEGASVKTMYSKEQKE